MRMYAYIFSVYLYVEIENIHTCVGVHVLQVTYAVGKILGMLQKLPFNSSQTKHAAFTIENMNSHSRQFCNIV